jgi:plastocyanin
MQDPGSAGADGPSHIERKSSGMKSNRLLSRVALAVLVLVSGCGGPDSAGESTGEVRPAGTVTAPVPHGTVHEVKMVSGNGERFEPADLTVKRGDVVRFILQSGVHNASFPADRNPAGVKLPAATPYLQAPGQTFDMVIDLPRGEYVYQCDPHAALGMMGTLTVTDG